MTIKAGLVWVPGGKGRFRPFMEFREIRKGRNKGRIEVLLPASDARRVIVDKESIRRYPAASGGAATVEYV